MSSSRKKLIEVALPLDEINKAAHDENNIHTGLPSNLHTWWSRKPLGVARAILFSSLVDDPADDLPETEADQKRRELFAIAAALADISNNDNDELLQRARREILASVGGEMPRFWDPFCGGGALPLEALRLGLPTFASDLNPVAVFITRVLIELAPKQAYHPSVNPKDQKTLLSNSAKFGGLKKDVEYYAGKIAAKLTKSMERFYPKATLPKSLGGGEAQVAAWLWTRTVRCPNPSCQAAAPLVNKFWLSTHTGNKAFALPVYRKASRDFSFTVQTSGEPPAGTVNRSGATCFACKNPITFDYIRTEGAKGRISYTLMAMAVEGPRGRVYLEPTSEQNEAALKCEPVWEPETDLPPSALGFRVQKYGITKHADLFTKRQMATLSRLAAEIDEIRADIVADAKGDDAYANLVHAFLALSLSRVAQTNNTLVRWFVRTSGTSKGTPAFDRQIVSMTWEFSEGNFFGTSVGSWKAAIKNPLTALNSVPSSTAEAKAIQHDASGAWEQGKGFVISTDPPYFDAIGYADLSDFFYIWLRRALSSAHRDIFSTMLVPKSGDLTRDLGRTEVPKKVASRTFLETLQEAFKSIHDASSDAVPITVYYAFKQAEVDASDEDDDTSIVASTGWETLLEGLFRAGLQITGTWPLRTESIGRLRAIGSNALAASIVLVCRKRKPNAGSATKGEFLAALKRELPQALRDLQRGNIAPVDLAQAAIGPGMSIYTRYESVIDAAGKSVPVRDALAIINQSLDEVLAEQEGEFDADSRWAVAWFDQFSFADGEYGVAEVLSKAKNTAISGLVQAGIVASKGGKVRLLKPAELDQDWDPSNASRLTVWEAVHQLIRLLESGGEDAAASIVAALGSGSEAVRDLAYRLYSVCERRRRATEGLAYNSLVQSWPEIMRLARATRPNPPSQPKLL